MFENRNYRSKSNREGLVSFKITVKETDLHIQASSDLSRIAQNKVLELRGFVENYTTIHPEFVTSFTPLEPVIPIIPQIVRDMIEAGKKAGVGPMAAVAGAIAELTGEELLKYSSEVIVENGGDIFFKINSPMVFTIFAGKSPLSMKIGARISPRKSYADSSIKKIISEKNTTINRLITYSGMALCTSSGTVGHSISFGKADAATVISQSCAVADAAATAIGNMVKQDSDIEKAIEAGKCIEGVEGIIIIKGKRLGAWGDLELVRVS
ncbi:MAG: UPF0280 family protein [Desulfamplus sp.]|nr:UPF0280 family protein [Desulfamplus sp.]